MPTPTTAAQVLRAAALILDTHPEMWGRDYWRDPTTGCRCSGGLIAYVIDPGYEDGDPYGLGDHSKHPARLLAEQSIALFEEHVRPELVDRYGEDGVRDAAKGEPLIGLWNDRFARGPAHVAETMRAAADSTVTVTA